MLSNRRAIKTVEALADPLGIDPDSLADILLISNLTHRKDLLSALLNGMSIRQWAFHAGMSQNATNLAVNNLDQAQLGNMVKIVRALDLDLKRFSEIYEQHMKASA